MQSGTKCWHAARRASSRGDIELGGRGVEVVDLSDLSGEEEKKRRWGDEIVWMTRDQFRFDMGVNRRGLMSEIFVFIGRWEFGNFADGGWGSSLSSVYWIPLVLR